MAFKIDTDKVNSVAESISSLYSEANSVSSSISGYDGSNDDGFDFSGAISAVANNVSGMETKFKNTVALLNAVTGTHTSLQDSANGEYDGDGEDTGTSVSSSSSRRSGGRRSSGGGSSGSSGTTLGAFAASANQINQQQDGNLFASNGAIPNTTLPNSTTPAFTSAREVLMKELGAPLTEVVSTLDENLDVTLSANKIDTIETDDLGVLSNGRAIIVVEGHSNDTMLPLYLKRVSKVAEEFTIELKFLKLDSIVKTPFAQDDTKAVSTTDTEENKKQSKEQEAEIKDNNKEETKEETPIDETKDESTKEDTSKEEKKEESNDKILDNETYNRLTALGTATYKNNILNSPVTLIVKDNKIVSSMNGHITEMTLRSMIQLSGITK